MLQVDMCCFLCRSEGVESSIEMPLESNKPVLDLMLDQVEMKE